MQYHERIKSGRGEGTDRAKPLVFGEGALEVELNLIEHDAVALLVVLCASLQPHSTAQ